MTGRPASGAPRSPASAPGAARKLPVSVQLASLEQLPIVALLAGYVTVAAAAHALWPHGRQLVAFGPDAIGAFAMIAVLYVAISLLGLMRRGYSLREHETWRQVRRIALAPAAVWRWLITLALFWPFLDVFRWVKSSIPDVNAFRWDPTFARLDAALHFGRQPWQWLQPVLGGAFATRALDVFYNVWFPLIVIGVIVWQALSPGSALRLQLLLCVLLAWIVLGTGMAMLFSSAGPCFYGRLMPGAVDPYAPLMAALRAAGGAEPLISVVSQDVLWAGYRGTGPPIGISAMPSVHVALPMILLLFGRRVNRWLALAMGAFLLLTLVSSVHLGWHYAVDGYFSILAVPPLWWAAGRFARWYTEWRTRVAARLLARSA
jgi:hypothetical protein